MLSRTFHWEVRHILAQFEDAFSDIVIGRFDRDRVEQDAIHVNFRYSPKTRALHEIRNKNQHFKMPVIAVSVGGMRRDQNRVFNKIDGTYWTDTSSPTTSAWTHLLQPVPIDITMNMSIVARFQHDIDQILSNFIPYCDPYIVVSWKWPDIIPFADFEIRSTILWNEDVSFQYPNDIAANVPYRIIADTSFTIKSWMFKNKPPDGKPIYVIDTSFTAVSAIEAYEVMLDLENDDNTDYSTDYTVISARPQFIVCDPFTLYESNIQPLWLYGRMFDYTSKLFVSAADFTIFDTISTGLLSAGVTYQNAFSANIYTSGAYPGFSGIEVAPSGWSIIDKNTLYVPYIPVSAGFVDIIAWNDAGYGKLSEDSIRPTLNPYPSTDPQFYNYIEYQYPCISGIEVRQLS